MTGIERRLRQLEEKAGMQVVPSFTIEVAFVGADGKTESSLILHADGKQEWKEPER